MLAILLLKNKKCFTPFMKMLLFYFKIVGLWQTFCDKLKNTKIVETIKVSSFKLIQLI